MKKILMLLAVGVMVISFNACTSGPEKDIDKMLKLVEGATASMEDAVEDKVIDEKEAEDINAVFKDFTDFSDEMEEKYKDDDEATAAQKEIYEEREDEISEIMEANTEVLLEMMSCEGADQIDLNF